MLGNIADNLFAGKRSHDKSGNAPPDKLAQKTRDASHSVKNPLPYLPEARGRGLRLLKLFLRLIQLLDDLPAGRRNLSCFVGKQFGRLVVATLRLGRGGG